MRVSEDFMQPDMSTHCAVRIPLTGMWMITWLQRDCRLSRNEAVTAMVMTETAAATVDHPVAVHTTSDAVTLLGERKWLHFAFWARELGLDGVTCLTRILAPPVWDPGDADAGPAAGTVTPGH